MTAERPNILCLVSEDCPPRLGAYGDPVARTPNLDALAHSGVTWDAANCVSPVCAPSRFALLTGRHPESVPPAHHMSALGSLPDEIVPYPVMMRQAGYYCTNNFKTHYNCDVDPAAIWDETSRAAHWRNRPGTQPFLAVFNCMETHESCVFNDFEGTVAPDAVTLPRYLPDTDGMRRSLASYYNHIEVMDAYMGERLRELDEAGIAEDTIVIYHSDHGSPLPRSKRFCYDEGLRTPLIVRVPQKWRHLLPHAPGSRIAAPVSLVDLLPTLASIAGTAPPPGIHGLAFAGEARSQRNHAPSGRDRMDEHYDLTRTLRGERFRYIRNYAPHRPWGQHYAFAWIAKGYQDYEAGHLGGTLDPIQDRFWQRKPAEELYDMAADPDAVTNLAVDPGHSDVLASMREALDAHMLAIHDCGFIPEGDPAEAWDASRDPEVYPLADVMAVAGRAIERAPTHADGFVATLDHGSAVMRFWAAQGLLMLAIEGTALPGGIDTVLAQEENPFVRVSLMEALGHAGDSERQVAALTGIAGNDDNNRLQLRAMEALHYLPLYPTISLDLMRHLAESSDEYVRGAAGYLKLRLEGAYEPTSPIFRFDLFRPGAQSGT